MDTLERALDAEDLRWISGYISVKDPDGAALWWHQDWWCWDHPVSFAPRAPQVAVLCYLTDTDSKNGALRLLPGTHLKSSTVHAALPEAHSATTLDVAHPAARNYDEQETLALTAGDAVALDYRLLHATRANRTGSRRACVLVSFAPDWRKLPADVRSHLIQHPALTGGESARVSWAARLLPRFDGPRVDLRVNRIPPSDFVVAEM